ncbi:MAG: ATP phosphoribosyltransferase [Acidimicrobiales bacterium]
MLRIALPNKGTLSEPANQMLLEAGYTTRHNSRDLSALDVTNNVEFIFLRPRDIATYVAAGTLDLGITGRDLLIDADSPAVEVMSLGFAASTFRLAGPAGLYPRIEDLDGKRVATSYPTLVSKFLADQGVTVETVRLDGAVEIAVRLGVADAIADVVETGATLRSTGLEIIGDPVLASEAVLIAPQRSALAEGASTAKAERGEISDELDQLIQRLQSVLVARQYLMIDYNIPVALLAEATALTPGVESPTISPLANPDWRAVRAMIPEGHAHQIMDALKRLGAQAILLNKIHACRI